MQRSPLKPNGRDSRYKDPPLPVRSTHSKSDSNSISQDSSELPEELRLSSILSSYSARNLTLRLENDYKVNSCPNSLFCQIAHAPLIMILSYLKTKTLLKKCHIILYWTQQFSIPGVVSWSWSAPVHPQCQRSLPDPQPGVHARSLAGDCFPTERLGHDRSRC